LGPSGACRRRSCADDDRNVALFDFDGRLRAHINALTIPVDDGFQIFKNS